jgi:ATP phosphoribosyltransferase regulatory subunit
MNIGSQLLKGEEKAVFKLRSLYEKFGYTQYRMSKFEEYELYVQNKNFLISDNIITFTENGKLMALKPDVTLSIVKSSKNRTDGLSKLYYDEKVYRSNDSGSFKEIMQVGLECIGDIDTYCKCEVLMLAAKSLEQISEEYVLDISHLGVVSAVLETLSLSEEIKSELITCLGQKNIHGVDEVLQKFGAPEGSADGIKKLIGVYGSPASVIDRLKSFFEYEEVREQIVELEKVASTLSAMIPEDKIRIDFSVVNDMTYYNGIVFKGFIKGIPSSILSGGQYDLLVRKMEKAKGAIGFAVYPELVRSLSSDKAEYDVDALIVYDDDADLRALYSTVKLLTDSGKTVSAQKTIPEKLRYKQLLRFKERGVEIVEDNA